MPKILPFLFISILLLSCEENSHAQLFDEKLSQPFTDPRDGKQYKTIKIGKSVYMADNLNYETGDSLSWCYKGDCKKYWRLYNWEKANSVCPSGWHLPTIYEWVNLDMAVFLLPDGHCDDIARFDMFLYDGWWTAKKEEKDVAYIYNPKIKKLIAPAEIDGDLNRLGCTLRCIQDNPYTNNFVLNSDNAAKYANYFDSVLVKHKTTTDWCIATEQDTSEISRLAKNDTLLKMFIIYNYNMICANPAEITTYWLNSKKKEYEMLFNKPVPECKQCSDLELLLMLENAIKTNEAELDIAPKEENAELKAELKKAQMDYEKKFKIRAPWWYICSDKEHLERLQKAIKTNKPELDHSYSSQMIDYRTGKYLASYEWLFKKPAPNWDEKECSEEERFKRLMKAIEENKPYLSEEEEKNRHSIHFKHGEYYITNISVSKTAAGAVIKYELPVKEKYVSANTRSADTLEANLSAKEWQNFTDTLQKLGIMEWEKVYLKPHKKGERRWRGEKNWEVEILLPNNAKFNSGGSYAYPPNYDEFVKLMEGMKRKAVQKLESKIKTEYEKRFGKPITEQELSTEQVIFSLELSNKTPINSTSQITITRTKTGAVAHYNYGPEEGVKLSMDDWLDFIYALYKNPFMKWEEEYGKMRMQALFNDIYWLSIYNSNSFNPKSFSGYNKYPPNWDKFLKVMNDIRAKAKKDSATREVEDKLKTEYKKRFGKPISDFELSIRSMDFGAFSKWIDHTVKVSLNRTATGALIEYYAGSEGVQLSEKLSMEEWMDLLNNLQKCPSNGRGGKFERWDICCRKNPNDYAILDIYVSWNLEIKSSGDSDELKFYANDICTPKWNEFMKIISNKRAAWK